MSRHYIGFVIDGNVPSLRNSWVQRDPFQLVRGRYSNTAVAEMRFGWLAEHTNKQNNGLYYELFRQWRRYSAIIFLKSMGKESVALAERAAQAGVKTIFDANVDYFSRADGVFYYSGMAPTDQQRCSATIMARGCDGVIGDSEHITEVASRYARRITTIEDNIKDSLIVRQSNWMPNASGKLDLLWSGQAAKLFELLAIKGALYALRDKIHLKIITNSMGAINLWYPPYKSEFMELMKNISHEIIAFESIDKLMAVYDQGGVFVSPRFLDNTYNLGHTEWKITLPMARGRIVLCSPQASYIRVSDLAEGKGVKICFTDEDWYSALTSCINGYMDWKNEQEKAIQVVAKHYRTEVIGKKHNAFVREILA